MPLGQWSLPSHAQALVCAARRGEEGRRGTCTICWLSSVRELFGKGLNRYFTPEVRITRTPHFAYSPFAEKAEDFVVGEFDAGLPGSLPVRTRRS